MERHCAAGSAQKLLDKLSPRAVENRLDINGPVRLGRATRLWQSFIRMHRALRDDHEGMEALLLQDFARAYEMQGRTLNPLGARPKQGAQQ